ncbi:MAG: glycosyltransferase family 2 protein, partial [Candidatus Andersenbacteria bacterium]|nr:glycosyltransferase family 2 protein [Candidatus Andersenbacteria bacterium]
MKLSIIIVNYKMAPLVAALVESLLQDELPKGTEIIVVDNDSRDESVSFLRSDYPEITVIDNKENLGLASGVNTGMAAARGQYYLILNPDMVALPGAVTKLVDFMDTHPDAGMAAGKLLSPNGKLQYSCFRFYKPMTIVYRRTPLGKTKAGQAEIAR